MRVKFLGSGDAFGSGGRLNTCFLVDRGEASFLIDCGASAMISIRRFSVDPNVWSGRALQEISDELVASGLASMYPAFDWSSWAPGHHGYQRACDLISGQASAGHLE